MKSKEEFDKNIWEEPQDINQIIEFIKAHVRKDDNKWTWSRNSRCKYISIRFDMRSGHFVLVDRDKNRITFDELKYQVE